MNNNMDIVNSDNRINNINNNKNNTEMAEQELLQKRNTDCVYFLASPLTCKKGADCEYRHNDMARLNPRDCWYWLAGSCLNPTCAFRHPPLDAHTDTSTETALTSHVPSAPVIKTNVPCFFYFNGFCNKGDRCSFRHRADDNAPALKSTKAVPVNVDGSHMQKKASIGSDTGSGADDNAPSWKPMKLVPVHVDGAHMQKKASIGSEAGSAAAETHLNSYETVLKATTDTGTKPEEEAHHSSVDNLDKQSTSPHKPRSAHARTAAVGSDSPPPSGGRVLGRSPASSHQSSDDQFEDQVEREEGLESSPGFDVLVDDKSEDLDYEDDSEYLLPLDGESREPNGQYMAYEFEENIEYDHVYTDLSVLYGQDIHESYNRLGEGDNYDYDRKVPLGERMVDYMSSHRRKLPIQLSNGRGCGDLREHLKRRRLTDAHSGNHFSRRLDSFHETLERPGQLDVGRLRGRLSSKVEGTLGRSRSERVLQGRLRDRRISRSRPHYRERREDRQHSSSEVSWRPATRKRRSAEDPSLFTGPKTLAQIKEEKKAARGNGSLHDIPGPSVIPTGEDFQGPKPLGEILKDKRRLGSVVDYNRDGP